MSEPTIRQYHGPSRRHPDACVELSFPCDDGTVGLAAIAEALCEIRPALRPSFPAEPVALPEAVGLASALLCSQLFVPRWSWGREDGIGWACLSHPAARFAAAALSTAHAAVLACRDEAAPLPAALRELAGQSPGIDPITAAMMRAAADLGLEATIVSPRTKVYQVGQGRQGRHFFELASQGDGLTGLRLANDKRATVELLQRLGLPTTKAVSVGSEAEIGDAVRRVGAPCVVKPVDRGKGKGVTAHVANPAQLAGAVANALRYGGYPILIENHVMGDDHRMMVVKGELLWVYRLRPARVVGDGTTTLRGLIARENRRREGASSAHRGYLLPIAADAALARYLADRHGSTLEPVPAEGVVVELAGEANLAKGGTLADVTAVVHPDNRELAREVARLFRLDAVGIDFMTPDIARSWRDVPSAIIEVNGAPGISGLGDAAHVLRHAFPSTHSGRVPCFVVIGGDDYRAAVAAPLRQALASCGLRAAGAQYGSVDGALIDPSAEAIVVEARAEDVERHGFPLRRCDGLVADAPIDLAGLELSGAFALIGTPAPAALSQWVAQAVAAFRAASDRPRATLEWVAGEDGQPPILRCWRLRAVPRRDFWQAVAGAAEGREGMVTPADLAKAVRYLSDRRLAGSGLAPLSADFVLPPTDGAWESPCVDAAIDLPADGRETAWEAIGRAVDEVNRIVAQAP